MDPLLQEPLTEANLDELSDFLMSDAMPPGCMDLVMLDGFLTAIAIGPEMVLPSGWLPEIWGDPEGPEFVSAADAQRIVGLVMRRYNEITLTLRDRPFTYEPLLYEMEYDQLDLDPWCLGFLSGMALQAPQWEPLLADRASEILLAPMMILGTEDGMKTIREGGSPGRTSKMAAAHCRIGRRSACLLERSAREAAGRRDCGHVPSGKGAGCRTQRTMPLWEREKIQEVLRTRGSPQLILRLGNLAVVTAHR